MIPNVPIRKRNYVTLKYYQAKTQNTVGTYCYQIFTDFGAISCNLKNRVDDDKVTIV